MQPEAPLGETTEEKLPVGTKPGEDEFRVDIEGFTGPFDLLLSLVARHRLDITEVSLAAVTDEFIAHMSRFPDLSQASEFIVVAATLLDIKVARLLPNAGGEDAEDLEYLEARDLLFSRLLQYRAFKEVAAQFAQDLEAGGAFWPREVPLEPHFAALLPELVWSITPQQLAEVAAGAISRQLPRPLTHLHDPVVPVREQVEVVMEVMRQKRVISFRALIADAQSRAVVVSRFLALLELFRAEAISFEQIEPLGELTIRWVGRDSIQIENIDDYEEGVDDETAH